MTFRPSIFQKSHNSALKKLSITVLDCPQNICLHFKLHHFTPNKRLLIKCLA